MSVDHSVVTARSDRDPLFLHVKAGMTVIVADTDGAWRMADVIWVDGGARNPKVRRCSRWLMSIPASSTWSTLTW